MDKYLKSFIHRGLVFGGFGPIILGIIYLCISSRIEGFMLSGIEVFIGILSVYLLAFVHAGASVFNQIEEWSITKSLLYHFSVLYIAYVTCYIINDWIGFEWEVILIFTLIFVVFYFTIWIIVYLITKKISNSLNEKLKDIGESNE